MQIELVLAVVLVVLVIFAFLHSPRATLIASLAVPISLIGTFGAMYLLGYSLNNLSLMALTIATGFVVDDAIVMIENISRHIEEGEPPMAGRDARAPREIGFTIISLTVSLIAVLIPLLFMGDVVGRLFREFAVTLAITILISAVVSLTLVPMMSARWLTAHPGGETGWGGRAAAPLRPRDRALRPTGWAGCWSASALTLLVALAHAGAHGAAVHLDSQGPVPDPGHRPVAGAAWRPSQSVSYTRMAAAAAGGGARRSWKTPTCETLSSFVGVDAANNTMLHTGRMLINLKSGHGNQQPGDGPAARSAPSASPASRCTCSRRRT